MELGIILDGWFSPIFRQLPQEQQREMVRVGFDDLTLILSGRRELTVVTVETVELLYHSFYGC